ncbi:MAG TPA: zf-HC2 domain-containing protein [Gemmatimonadales bacterium]|nr:zf-HC2 domain-containing protein [Gemmatimonadales bacterium]
MMCPEMEVRLNEYVDGTLAARERAAVEAHLAECAGCRAAIVELRALVTAAATLPKSIPPKRDLWGDIARRLGKRERGNGKRVWRERAFWRRALAAAAVLVIALGIYRLLPPITAHYRPAGQGWVAVQADFDRASGELGRALALERHRLRPETVALLERNLEIIDAAIAESRAALARDPANAELRGLFAAAYRHKVELLRWAAHAATS